jgi:hypothetical protein
LERELDETVVTTVFRLLHLRYEQAETSARRDPGCAHRTQPTVTASGALSADKNRELLLAERSLPIAMTGQWGKPEKWDVMLRVWVSLSSSETELGAPGKDGEPGIEFTVTVNVRSRVAKRAGF